MKLKFEDVELLEYEVAEEAENIVYELGDKIEKMAKCSCTPCSLPISLAGSAYGYEVLIASMLMYQLIDKYGNELDVDLGKVFGSVKGLKAFQAELLAKRLV